MKKQMAYVWRGLLLPLLVYLAFLAYGQLLGLLEALLPVSEDEQLRLVSIVMQGFVAAAVIALLFSHLLAKVYGKLAVGAALLLVLPIVYLSWPGSLSTASNPLVWLLRAYDSLALMILLMLGTWLAYRRLASSVAHVQEKIEQNPA